MGHLERKFDWKWGDWPYQWAKENVTPYSYRLTDRRYICHVITSATLYMCQI